MKLVDVQQGTPEWLRARMGKPSASQFHRILTPKTLKPSGQQKAYLCELVAERLFDEPNESAGSAFMERGREQEPQARAWYSFTRDVEVQIVGGVTTDDGRIWCSPDGLVGDDGGLEIKTPGAVEFTRIKLDGIDKEWRCQVQGCLWVCERKWWDVLVWNPSAEPHVQRIERDDEFISHLSAAVTAFADLVDETEQRQAA